MGEDRPISYYWAKKPVRRQVEAGLMMLDDEVLGTLARLELLVWRNRHGHQGKGFVYLDTGQKASVDYVLLHLARMNPAGKKRVRRNLDVLKRADEVAFDKGGRPYLKHFYRDRNDPRSTESESKTRRRVEDLLPEAARLLPDFLRSGEPRREDALVDWLCWKMGRKPDTVFRLLDMLRDRGCLMVGDGIVSIRPASPSPPSAAPAPPQEERKAKDLNMSRTCPEDIEEDSIAEEGFFEAPIEAIDEPPSVFLPPAAKTDGSGSRERGGQEPPKARCAGAGGSSTVTRRNRSFGFSRDLSGKTYRGWVYGSHPHVIRSKGELLDFKSEHLWSCDVIDGLLFLAPDGTPVGDARYPAGQPGAFKAMLRKLNLAAGGAGCADQLIRERVFVEFVEDKLHQREPFDCDAKIVMSKLQGLLSELQAMGG